MTLPYTLIERLPTLEEHHKLWTSVGWDAVSIEMARLSLLSSVYGLVVADQDHIIGMGRIVGDGVMYFYIQDVAVLPEYQGQGIGRRIVDQLLLYIQAHGHPGAFAGLFASHGNDAFYEKFGFQNHAPGMTGMFKVIE